MYLKSKQTLKMKKNFVRIKKELEALKDQWVCDICCEKYKTVVFQCGHRTCSICC